MDEFTIGTSPGERHHERRDHQIGRLSFAHRPADEGLVEEVADAGEKELAVETVELRDVRDPALVGAARAEVALEQVRGVGGVGLAPSPLLSTVHAHQPVFDHDPRHAVTPDPVTAMAQLSEDARRAVGVAREGVDLFDLPQERVVLPRSLTGLVVQPRVVGGTGKFDDPTEILHGVLGLVVVDEAAAGHRSVSFAK
jgi:hypothetical protein